MSEMKKPEAEILLEKQLELASKAKKSNIITSAIFLVLIFAVSIAFWIVPDNEYSGEEKRSLKQLPEISFERFVSDLKQDCKEIFMTYDEKQALKDQREDFADEIAEYYADQFPARNAMRALKGYTEMLLCKGESNGIIITNGMLINPDTITGTAKDEDGNVCDRNEEDAIKNITKNIGYINYLSKMLGTSGVEVYTALAGRTVDVNRDILPSLYPSEVNDAFWNAYTEGASKAGINTVDILSPLRKHVNDGEYVYYKTDHHWTTLGAYYAYCEIIKSLGEEPLPIDSFTKEIASEDFLGTVYAKSGIAPSGADTITFFRFENDEQFTTTIPVGEEVTEYKGFYNRKYLEDADKYSAFLGHDNFTFGGNNPLTLITKDGEENREKLVLIKDSFAHSLAPFLAYHYDLIILDMRYYIPDGNINKTVMQYASEENVSKVLILYNMETFMNDEYLMRIMG